VESTKDVGKNVEANKYQEAIDKLRSLLGKIAFLFGYKENKHPIKTSEELNTLQELVYKVPYYEQCEAKAIPMKPIELYDEFKDSYTNCCPKCELEVDENYCPNCGQAIDWSKDE